MTTPGQGRRGGGESGESGAAAVEIRRSARRKRTVSAYRDGDRTVVLLPAGLRRADEQRWVTEMLRRLAVRDSRARRSDVDLLERARALSRRYFDDAADPASVRWVGNQGARWGSCTPADRTIRLSRRLTGMPAWVVDYVLVHELAHLLEPGHGPRFWELVGRYPRTERARGYLEGVAATAGLADPEREGDESGEGDEDGQDGKDGRGADRHGDGRQRTDRSGKGPPGEAGEDPAGLW